MSQVVEFRIEDVPISVSPRDATRMVEALRADAASDSVTAADKIEDAMKLHSDTSVRLGIGEDECVLQALAELRATRDSISPLARLERAIKTKIEREG